MEHNKEYNKHGVTFFNTRVTVVPTPDGSGNSVDGQYQVTYLPGESIKVATSSAVINYQLVHPTPADIVFTGMRTDQSDLDPQFSIPTISQDGRMLTFSDSNSRKELIKITLLWRAGVAIAHDPQVENDPRG
ncbi:hypothetical protein [Janthinobacterium fluminis]|uniref:Uncharacterized protein n=1 Tax=Janthinobacterium fluminis TaxID=2987524 RepID=A0ABT5JYI0_9BURK|nr:hypothetical protein [Janthinobacterium fluminis]MDC8757106.1 hypothetical protein [Janthinobacterium fluminis]